MTRQFMNPVTIIIAVAVILVAGYFAYTSKKQPIYEILETRDFECKGMEGFTFKYPVFKGWEILSTKENKTSGGNDECFLLLNHPQEILLETNPQIIVTKAPYSEKDFEIPAQAVSYPNKNNVPYIYTKEGSLREIKNYGYVGFYGKDFKFWVSLDGISEKSGFPTDQFFKVVIESFRIIDVSKVSQSFSGEWRWRSGSEELTLYLEQKGNKITGYHSAIGKGGNRVDEAQAPAEFSIKGEVDGSDYSRAVVTFRSGFPDSNGKGRAEIKIEENNLSWKVIESQGEHYFPQKAALKKFGN